MMYCLQWLIPVLLLPKPINPAFLYNHAMFVVLYLVGFVLERRPCAICSLVFATAIFFICYSCQGNCILWPCGEQDAGGSSVTHWPTQLWTKFVARGLAGHTRYQVWDTLHMVLWYNCYNVCNNCGVTRISTFFTLFRTFSFYHLFRSHVSSNDLSWEDVKVTFQTIHPFYHQQSESLGTSFLCLYISWNMCLPVQNDSYWY